MNPFFQRAGLVVLALLFCQLVGRAETVSIVIASNAAPRVQFGAEKLVEALKAVKLDAALVRSNPQKINAVLTGKAPEDAGGRKIYLTVLPSGGGRESFMLKPTMVGDNPAVFGNDDSGLFYGCLELAGQIRAAGKLPGDVNFADAPKMTLRGTCIGMQ